MLIPLIWFKQAVVKQAEQECCLVVDPAFASVTEQTEGTVASAFEEAFPSSSGVGIEAFAVASSAMASFVVASFVGASSVVASSAVQRKVVASSLAGMDTVPLA
jgi:hypothetical protein